MHVALEGTLVTIMYSSVYLCFRDQAALEMSCGVAARPRPSSRIMIFQRVIKTATAEEIAVALEIISPSVAVVTIEE